jgi:Bacterial regulatory helix-turn-helix protein, lysR family
MFSGQQIKGTLTENPPTVMNCRPTKGNPFMDLLHALGTFVRVVETGSFSSVARETSSNQSTVTRRIGQLEDHLGIRVFHRTTRHLSLTDDGRLAA